MAAMVLVASLGACGSEPDAASEGEIPGLELWTVVEAGSEDTAPAEAALLEGDDGVPGESRDGVVEKAGCVHIQWCNEPGPVGTVCIWDSCSLGAAVDECTRDAIAVCGRITQPAEIR